MKKILAMAALCTALTGCMNLWTRNPFTDTEIFSVYQSSRMMAGGAVLVAFPQAMSDWPGDGGFMLENIFTIPLGCLVRRGLRGCCRHGVPAVRLAHVRLPKERRGEPLA